MQSADKGIGILIVGVGDLAGLVYAIEGRATAPRSGKVEDLPERLRPVLLGSSWSIAQCSDGPGKKPCFVISPEPAEGSGGEPGQPGFFADRQYWCRVAKAAGGPTDYWIGLDTAARPRPADLVRAGGVPGFSINLRDGNRWSIAGIRVGESCTVPQGFSVGEDGAIGLTPDPRFADLQQEAETWWDDCVHRRAIVGERAKEWFAFAVKLLAVNYRVDAKICSDSCLGLFSTDMDLMIVVLYAAFGGPAALAELEAQKKTLIAGDGIGGSAEGIADCGLRIAD